MPELPHQSWLLLRSCAVFAATLLTAAVASGAGPLGENGNAIETSHYKVDLTQSNVFAGSRVTGLGGAYVAIAEGTDGNPQNPAAPAVRPAYSLDYFDFELDLAVTLPVTLASTDYFNTGQDTKLIDQLQSDFVFIVPALNLQWGDFGVGATLEFQRYNLRQTPPDEPAQRNSLAAQFFVGHVQAAKAFAHRQLVLGIGGRLVSLDVNGGGQTLFTTNGSGIEVGAVWRPHHERYRIGAAFRSAVSTRPDANSAVQPNMEGDRILFEMDPDVAPLWLPNQVTLPWDLNVGVALQFGPRPFNPPWRYAGEGLERTEDRLERSQARRDGAWQTQEAVLEQHGGPSAELEEAHAATEDRHSGWEEWSLAEQERRDRDRLRERYHRLPRRYWLLSMSLLVTGKVRQAVGIESFLQRTVNRSGQAIVFSPRLGLETETVPNWMKVRAGAYGEPTRFELGSPRVHGTLGLDVKLFPWTVWGIFDEDAAWRLSAAMDAAARYLTWGVGIGLWH